MEKVNKLLTARGLVLSENCSMLLDFIRVLAAQMVLFGHTMGTFGVKPFEPGVDFPYIQDIGVPIFFVLSGFLIAFSIERNISHKKGYGFLDFSIDRFSRIYSGLIPCLIFILAVDLTVKHLGGALSLPTDIKTFFGQLFLLSEHPLFPVHEDHSKLYSLFNIKLSPAWSLNIFGSGRPLWTLATEWWIYLFIGFLYLGKSILKKSFIIYLILLLLFAIVPFQNRQGLMTVWILGWAVYFITSRKLLHRFNPHVVFSTGIFLLIIYIASLAYTLNAFSRICQVLLFFSLLCLIYGANNIDKVYFGFLRNKIKYMADYSFTLYMIHFTMLYALKAFTWELTEISEAIVFVVLSQFVAISLAYMGEFHHLKLRRYMKSLKSKFI